MTGASSPGTAYVSPSQRPRSIFAQRVQQNGWCFSVAGLPQTGPLQGISLFPGASVGRSIPVDRNNFAPRLGLAYGLTKNTVVRAGAGVVYSKTPNNGFFSQAIGSSNPYFGTGIYQPATTASHLRWKEAAHNVELRD